MISFANDYSEGAHPRILEMMGRANLEQNDGYGLDAHSEKARQLIKRAVGREDVSIHFLTGGTQTNLLAISSVLRPHQAVITASTGHINVHECGAIEAAGHKVLTWHCEDGRLTPEGICRLFTEHTTEHMVMPKMVYLSDSTELGTIYTKAQLTDIHNCCRDHGLYLFLDGARIGTALMAEGNDLTLRDLASLTDAFYIGGTKNGALLGEAYVICNPAFDEDFRYQMKQKGAMLAKGFLIGIQYEALFKDNLYFELAAHANRMAQRLKDGMLDMGVKFLVDSPTNQQFPILDHRIIQQLEQKFLFHTEKVIDEAHTCIRLVTSWATKESYVEDFLKDLLTLLS